MTSIEDLIHQFHRANRLSIHNPTHYFLEMIHGGGVATQRPISANTRIGEVHGDPMYIWDIPHTDYMVVGDEFVLDVSRLQPRSILTYLRDENQATNPANCILIAEACPQTGTNRFFFNTICDIQAGEELIYITVDYPYY